MKYSIMIAAGVAMTASSLAFADGATLFKERTCWSCHGKDAKTPIMPNYPKIAGQNAAYIEQQMKDIKSGARSNGQTAAMKGIMFLVNDADIKELADYLSKLPPK